ncbi:MAG: GH32 C-terminal domain-containing protein, partial [Clostridia bacterium]|nr:GH32 C-terminal domain-containing protein [Clostridia bacterium]
KRFASQMSFPTEMHLEKVDGDIYLCAEPIKEIEALYTNGDILQDIPLSDNVSAETGPNALDISLSMAYTAGEKLVMNVLGTDIAIDMNLNEIRCKNAKLPLSVKADRVDMRLIVDRCSLEIFADGGKSFAAVIAFADRNLPRIVLNKNEKLTVDRLEWHALENIHGN